jgi:Fe-S cluster assembly ATP-binding protein
VRDLVKICGDGGADPESLGDSLQALRLLDRPVNEGFSGGEIKRSELLQLLAQGPELVLLDEPESGVDLESIALVGGAINAILERGVPDDGNGRTVKERHEERHHSGLVITHTGYILDYVDADRGVVLLNGKIICESNPREILRMIKTSGYEECERCARI